MIIYDIGQFSKNFEYKIDHFSKTKIAKIGKWFFPRVFRTLRILWDNIFLLFLVNFQSSLNTKSTISQKLKLAKLFFHSFQTNMVHLLGLKTKFSHFWRGGGFERLRSLTLGSEVVNEVLKFGYSMKTVLVPYIFHKDSSLAVV